MIKKKQPPSTKPPTPVKVSKLAEKEVQSVDNKVNEAGIFER